jgi:hypothetical protein
MDGAFHLRHMTRLPRLSRGLQMVLDLDSEMRVCARTRRLRDIEKPRAQTVSSRATSFCA